MTSDERDTLGLIAAIALLAFIGLIAACIGAGIGWHKTTEKFQAFDNRIRRLEQIGK